MKLALIIISTAASLFVLKPVVAVAGPTGSKAPAFRLVDSSGAEVALEDFAGKVLLLNFWATWCVSCREELPELDRLHRNYRDQGFAVIGINVDASAERAIAFLKKRPVGFPVLMDTRGDVAETFRFSGLPASFLIGRDGFIVHTYRGSGTEVLSRYETDIAELLKKN